MPEMQSPNRKVNKQAATSPRTASPSMIRDMTEGPVASQLLRFALPLFVSNALQAVYNLVDMIIVGNFIGKTGLSAVSIGGDILHLLTFVAMGFSSAGQVIIARAVGAGRYDDVKKTIGTMFSFLLSIAAPSASAAYTMDYTVTCIFGLVFIYGYNIVSAILRGMGDSKRPFLFIAIAAVLNTVLDLLFVRYLGLAVFGAALATVIGQGTSFVLALIYLYRRRESFGFDFRPESFRIEKNTLKRLLALGIPMAIQSAAINFSKIILTSWINLFDVTYSALAGIFNKINMMSGVISASFTTAGSTMTGQNLAAGKTDRVNRILLLILAIGCSFAAAASLVMKLWPDAVFSVFTTDEEVLSLAGVLIVPIIFNFFGAATRSASFALINGSGRPKLNLAVAIIDGVIARIGLAALLGFALKLDCFGFWMGDSLAGFMPFLIGSTFYLSGRWKERAE